MNVVKKSAVLLQYCQYDALNGLVAIQAASQSTRRRFYSGAFLGNELNGTVQRTYLSPGGALAGIREQENGPATVRLFGTEQQGSVVKVLGGSGQQNLAYTPHGEGADPALPGFNGEHPDPLTGNYLLGNGYRAYNPTLLRFHSPDSFSPFGGGGLNLYSYCMGDPVNRADPTGHLSWQAGVGIGLGIFGLLSGGHGLVFGGIALSSGLSAASVAMVVSGAAGLGAAGAGVAQAVIAESQPNSAAAATLGWIALGLGAASAAAGMAASQWSPANASQPVQEARMSGGKSGMSFHLYEIQRAEEASRALRVAREQSLRLVFSQPSPTPGSVGGLRTLMSMLSSNDLIRFASTSRYMYNMVHQALRPLDSFGAHRLGGANLQALIETIGAGQMPGTLPSQLTRVGILQSSLPSLFTERQASGLTARQITCINTIGAGRRRQRILREQSARHW